MVDFLARDTKIRLGLKKKGRDVGRKIIVPLPPEHSEVYFLVIPKVCNATEYNVFLCKWLMNLIIYENFIDSDA